MCRRWWVRRSICRRSCGKLRVSALEKNHHSKVRQWQARCLVPNEYPRHTRCGGLGARRHPGLSRTPWIINGRIATTPPLRSQAFHLRSSPVTTVQFARPSKTPRVWVPGSTLSGPFNVVTVVETNAERHDSFQSCRRCMRIENAAFTDQGSPLRRLEPAAERQGGVLMPSD